MKDKDKTKEQLMEELWNCANELLNWKHQDPSACLPNRRQAGGGGSKNGMGIDGQTAA